MDKLVFALLMTLLGLALGALGVAIEWGLHFLFQYISLPAPWPRVLALMLLGALALGIVWFAYQMLFSDAPSDIQQRVDALRTVSEAIEGIGRTGEILSSKDGSFLNVILRVPLEEWNSSIPFYHEGVPYHSPQIWEKDFYIYIFIVYENGRAETLPIPFHSTETIPDTFYSNEVSCVMTIHFAVKGLNHISLKILYWLHSGFSEADIGILKTILTSIFVFVISLIQRGVTAKWKRYCDEKMFPMLRKRNPEFPGPPAGIAFSQVEIEFKSDKLRALRPLSVELKDKPANRAITEIVELMYRFDYFDHKLQSRLDWPYGE